MAGRVLRRKNGAPGDLRQPDGKALGRGGRIGAARTIQCDGGQGAHATRLRASSDTAIRLLGDIKAHRIDPADLTVPQRRACLLLLANGSQTAAELGVLFKTSAVLIRRDLSAIREEVGREVREWTIEEVLGQVALASDKCSAMAMKSNDPGLAWTIHRDFAKLLREFGVVDTRPQDSLSVTIEAIGEGYERARTALSHALDPRLTGIAPDAPPVIDATSSPSVPLERRLAQVLPGDPGPREGPRDPRGGLDDPRP